MKRIAALIITMALAVTIANGAAKKAYELVAFDYEELALQTDNAVRIKWSGTVESYLTYNGECLVVMTLTMESGEEHAFATVPFTVQGLGRKDVSSEFKVPRSQWDGASSIEVGAQEYTEAVATEDEAAQTGQEMSPLEACIRQTVADPKSYPALKGELDEVRGEVLQLETDLMISSGLLRKEESSQGKIDRQQKHLQAKEEELEKLLGKLRYIVEQYCRDLGSE